MVQGIVRHCFSRDTGIDGHASEQELLRRYREMGYFIVYALAFVEARGARFRAFNESAGGHLHASVIPCFGDFFDAYVVCQIPM